MLPLGCLPLRGADGSLMEPEDLEKNETFFDMRDGVTLTISGYCLIK